jgi:hypothetical protein
MENITFNELLSIIEDKGLNMTWCNHDNWTVNRALGYIEGLLKLCPSDIKINGRNIEIYYKDQLVQKYIIAG